MLDAIAQMMSTGREGEQVYLTEWNICIVLAYTISFSFC